MILERFNKYFDPFYKRFFSVTKDSWKYYAKFQPTSARILRNSSTKLLQKRSWFRLHA